MLPSDVTATVEWFSAIPYYPACKARVLYPIQGPPSIEKILNFVIM